VIQDAVLALPLLKPGGYILFDDVPFRFAHSPRQDTARAVEFFAEVFHDELTCIHKEYQMLLQKAL
jgi:predicted O-methyltransferase YrrM